MNELLLDDKALTTFDFALIAHEVTPSAINNLKDLLFSLKAFIPSIHLAINNSSPSLHEALISSGAKTCVSKPISRQTLSKTLVPSAMSTSNNMFNLPKHRVPIKVLAVDDNEANLNLIKELAAYEKEPDAVVVTEEIS